MKTETISINELLNFKNPENSQFFIKLDVEGMDIEVVKASLKTCGFQIMIKEKSCWKFIRARPGHIS